MWSNVLIPEFKLYLESYIQSFNMDGDNRNFAYQPLRPAYDEIRLLVLHPAANPHVQIQCDLEITSLQSKPRFEELSYVWGEPGNRGTMQLSGCTFSLFESLDAAMMRLRRTDASRVLWIDAVCINQNDKHEKTFQIPQMRRIYEEAEQVCIWLGGAAISSIIGMEALRADLLRFKKHWAAWKLSCQHGYLLPRMKQMFNGSMNAQATSELGAEIHVGEVRELLCRPWWTRLVQKALIKSSRYAVY